MTTSYIRIPDFRTWNVLPEGETIPPHTPFVQVVEGCQPCWFEEGVDYALAGGGGYLNTLVEGTPWIGMAEVPTSPGMVISADYVHDSSDVVTDTLHRLSVRWYTSQGTLVPDDRIRKVHAVLVDGGKCVPPELDEANHSPRLDGEGDCWTRNAKGTWDQGRALCGFTLAEVEAVYGPLTLA